MFCEWRGYFGIVILLSIALCLIAFSYPKLCAKLINKAKVMNLVPDYLSVVHLGVYCTTGAYPGFGRGGAKNIFFEIWEFACREATCCAWRSHAHC